MKRFTTRRNLRRLIVPGVLSGAFVFLFLVASVPAAVPDSAAKNNRQDLVEASFPGENLGNIPDSPSGCGNPAPTSRDILFNVSGLPGRVSSITISANILHTWVGDLTATLIAPGGQQHVLFSNTGGTPSFLCGDGSDLIGNYTFTDTAAGTNWWTAAAENINSIPLGSYRTTEPGPLADPGTSAVTELNSTFAGILPNGVWTLRINDANFGDAGSVESAQLSVTADVVPLNAPYDFDGDGLTDASIFRPNPPALANDLGTAPSTSEWWVRFSSNMSGLVALFGTPDDILVPADYTGDGKADVAFFRPSEGVWYVLRSEDMAYYSFPFGSTGDKPVHGDFDGDGIADPGVYRPSEGNWYLLRSSDGIVNIIHFGLAEDLPTVSDFDGDGMDDIGVFRPSVQEWWQETSTEGVKACQFGAPGDRTVVGDYTGDGRADVAFFRPSTFQWYILRSEDSNYYAFPWGSAGDIPVPGDYDGDGIFDAAVYRPSENTWYINGSTNGFEAFPFGTSTDFPVPSVQVVP